MSFVEIEDKFYILSTSSFADDRTVVLKQGESFGIFDRFGDNHKVGQGAQGLYHEGTRFLSKMEMLLQNERPLFLSSNLKEENELLSVDLTNQDFRMEGEAVLERGSIHILRSKFLWKGVCYEKIRFSNYALHPVSFTVTLRFDADFRDIFEVRGMEREKKGKIQEAETQDQSVILSYLGLDQIERRTRISFTPEPAEVENTEARFTVALKPHQDYALTVSTAFEIAEAKPQVLIFEEAHQEMLQNISNTKRHACDIFTSNEQFNEWIARSAADLITMITMTENGPYPYAGVPWYSTPFGRDGIITAFECLWLAPEVSKGVLQYLAATQATEENDFQDSEPGKILHEKRGGEMAELGEVPFKLYYGTIDATPLFVCLAGAYLERTDDQATIRGIWKNIEAALHWIDAYGDLDGDGFVEYARKAKSGLDNQGWKDSHDSISYANGDLATPPIALCEVQGYMYEAKLRGAEMAEALGHTDSASRWRKEAEKLKANFNEVFWSKEKQTFVLALDKDKKPCNIITSNAGHCLFSGIATQKHAEKTARTFLSEEMFSGWGIRTLATSETRYNPMSYHNGSIWPHDNALIAYGFSRYGLREEVLKVLTGTFDTSIFSADKRLPELFCGFPKRRGEGPTAYPVACSPQAWAVASVFLLLQACLGIRIDARKNTIYFEKPALPGYLSDITIRNLKVKDQVIGLHIQKRMDEVSVQLLDKESDLKIEVNY
jgi:glycogen debranching enzyme